MIELKSLSKIYQSKGNDVKALDNITYTFSDNSFLGITGGSGNGKTTLINIIGGLLRPTEGNVIINGTDLYRMKDKKISAYRNKTIGFIFQHYNLIDGISALENVMLPLMIGKVKLSKRKIMAEEALNTVGLFERKKHKPSELSGGQKQRVAIARAIVNSPDIIIADEPTGNLDEENARLIMELLSQINKKGVTILMVTHNESFKDYFSHNIRVEKGKIIC